MKNYKLLLLLLCLATATLAQAQVTKLWSQTIGKSVQWQKITSLGHYIIGTSQGIMGVNPETGAKIWEDTQFGAVSADQVAQVGSSPLLSINLGSTVYMIDPYTGGVRFDSKKSGILEIKDQQVLYNANGILISGRNTDNKELLLMSSLETGQVVWKIREDFGRLVTANELSPDALLIVTLYYNYKLNPKTGKIIWKNDVSEANAQMAKMGAFGNMMKQMASNAAQNVDLNVRFYKDPKHPVFYVASEQEGQAQTTGFTTTSNGETPHHTTYTAFDLKDGHRIWKKPLDVSGKMGPLYFDEKGLVILPNDGMNTKINQYDYQSQEGKWGKKGRGLKVKGGIYSYTKVDGGLLLVSQNTSGKNFITYLNLATGTLSFDKPVKVDGEVVMSEHTPKGLLYATTEEVNIMNEESGDMLLKKSIPTRPSLIAQNESTLYAFDTKEGVIKALDKNTGAVKTLSEEINFEGKEAPEHLDLRKTGLLLGASQNMALIGLEGKKVYQKYLAAPREPGILRALQYAQAVRAAYIGAASYAASAAYQSAGEQVKEDDAVAGAIVSGVGKAYGELGDAASDFAKKSWQAANARFKATQEADNYSVMLTQQDKVNTLVKVNKDTGASEGTISLGKDNAPDYVMDGVTGTVFYHTDGNTITAYQF